MEKPEKKRGLGRGLSALMADVEPAVSSTTSRADRRLPIEQIVPNPNQPRRSFTPEQLQELSDSIRAKGIIQPIIVRPQGEGRYEIVAGERRWRAAQMAQLHEIPVLVRELNDTEVLELAIIENIQRADLNAIEEASGYRQLMDRFGHTQERLAEALGKSRSHIANLLRLLNLPDAVQQLVNDGKLSAGHARALITAENPEELAQKVVARGLSVRDTEKLAKAKGDEVNNIFDPKTPRTAKSEKDADTRALEQDLTAALRMSVTIDHAPDQESGTIKVAYKSLEDLDELCRLLSVGR